MALQKLKLKTYTNVPKVLKLKYNIVQTIIFIEISAKSDSKQKKLLWCQIWKKSLSKQTILEIGRARAFLFLLKIVFNKSFFSICLKNCLNLEPLSMFCMKINQDWKVLLLKTHNFIVSVMLKKSPCPIWVCSVIDTCLIRAMPDNTEVTYCPQMLCWHQQPQF